MLLQLAQDASNDTYLIMGFILLGVSLALLLIELFVPSGGLIGVLAGIAAIASLVAFFMYDVTWGGVATGAYLVLGPIGGFYFFRWWLNSPFADRIVLKSTLNGEAEENDDTASYEQERRRLARLQELRGLVGAEGVTETALRPVGTVRIEGERVEALAESGAIDAGMPVIVSDVYDNQIKVRKR